MYYTLGMGFHSQKLQDNTILCCTAWKLFSVYLKKLIMDNCLHIIGISDENVIALQEKKQHKYIFGYGNEMLMKSDFKLCGPAKKDKMICDC